jgi:ribosome biogenesis GTP-binding protein YsxC/EngB
MAPQRTAFANTVFSGRIEIHPVLVRDTMYKLPFSLIPQVAFVGRSNVGKSSLINSLLHGREVARPSPLPGRTRQLFTFDVANTISLVDLPGYGFAGKVSKTERDEWSEMMQQYISNANGLERIVSLIDCRHGVKRMDEEFWKTIIKSPIHPKRRNKAQVVVTLTKSDLLASNELQKTMRATVAMVEHYKKTEGLHVWPFVHAVSTEKGDGIKELRSALCSMCPVSGHN